MVLRGASHRAYDSRGRARVPATTGGLSTPLGIPPWARSEEANLQVDAAPRFPEY